MAGTTTVDDIVDERSLHVKRKDNERERATSGHVFRIFLTLVASELIAYKDMVKKAWWRLGTGIVKDWRRPGGGLGWTGREYQRTAETGRDRQRLAEPGENWNGLSQTYRELKDSLNTWVRGQREWDPDYYPETMEPGFGKGKSKGKGKGKSVSGYGGKGKNFPKGKSDPGFMDKGNSLQKGKQKGDGKYNDLHNLSVKEGTMGKGKAPDKRGQG